MTHRERRAMADAYLRQHGSRWSFHGLCRDLGSDVALELLELMPGRGQNSPQFVLDPIEPAYGPWDEVHDEVPGPEPVPPWRLGMMRYFYGNDPVFEAARRELGALLRVARDETGLT